MKEEKAKYETAFQEEASKAEGAGGTRMDGEVDPNTPEGRLAEAERQRDEYKDKMLRAQAESANSSKRLNQQHAEALKLAGMGLARGLLPVLDNFERTQANLKTAHADDPVIAGVRLIAEQLGKALKDHGVEPIEAIGRPFDPTLHEALLHDRNSTEAPGKVTQEFERGYKMHDRVLRHAKVAVAAEPMEEESGKGADAAGE